MNQKLKAFLVGAVALVALLVMDAYVRDSPTPQNDELTYHRMASEWFETHTFVFAYMEDFDLAQNGIVEVDPSPYEVR